MALLSFVQGWPIQCTGFPTMVFFSRPFPSSRPNVSFLGFHLRPRARVLVRTCQLSVTFLLSLPQRNVGLTAFQRDFQPKKKAGESHRVTCGLPVLFINRLCWVLLPEGIKAKGGGEGPLGKTTLFKKGGSRGAVVKWKIMVVTDAAGLAIILEPMGFCLTWLLILGVTLNK